MAVTTTVKSVFNLIDMPNYYIGVYMDTPLTQIVNHEQVRVIIEALIKIRFSGCDSVKDCRNAKKDNQVPCPACIAEEALRCL